MLEIMTFIQLMFRVSSKPQNVLSWGFFSKIILYLEAGTIPLISRTQQLLSTSFLNYFSDKSSVTSTNAQLTPK